MGSKNQKPQHTLSSRIVSLCSIGCVICLFASGFFILKEDVLTKRHIAYIEAQESQIEQGGTLTQETISKFFEDNKEDLAGLLDDISSNKPLDGAGTYVLSGSEDIQFTGGCIGSIPHFSKNAGKKIAAEMKALDIKEFSVTDSGLVLMKLCDYTGSSKADQGLLYYTGELNNNLAGFSASQLSDSWYWYSWESLG